MKANDVSSSGGSRNGVKVSERSFLKADWAPDETSLAEGRLTGLQIAMQRHCYAACLVFRPIYFGGPGHLNDGYDWRHLPLSAPDPGFSQAVRSKS